MREKNFFQDKWIKDQYNERNPGQRNDARAGKKAAAETPSLPKADDVLRVMLNTPPQPHLPATKKQPKSRAKPQDK